MSVTLHSRLHYSPSSLAAQDASCTEEESRREERGKGDGVSGFMTVFRGSRNLQPLRKSQTFFSERGAIVTLSFSTYLDYLIWFNVPPNCPADHVIGDGLAPGAECRANTLRAFKLLPLHFLKRERTPSGTHSPLRMSKMTIACARATFLSHERPSQRRNTSNQEPKRTTAKAFGKCSLQPRSAWRPGRLLPLQAGGPH